MNQDLLKALRMNVQDSLLYGGRREVAIQEYEREHRRKGHLTDSEIAELSRSEFFERPVGVEAQIRKYFLLVKSENPTSASRMQAEISLVLESRVDGACTPEMVTQICKVVQRHRPAGCIISYEGTMYTS